MHPFNFLKLVTAVLLLILRTSGFGQCPVGQLTLTTQMEVDDFNIDYPGCTHMTHTLIISGDDIDDLTPLSMLDTIDGDLFVLENDVLINLDGLSGLSFVSNLNISNNPQLEALTGLEGLENIGFSIV